MLALCQHNTLVYYTFYYAGIFKQAYSLARAMSPFSQIHVTQHTVQLESSHPVDSSAKIQAPSRQLRQNQATQQMVQLQSQVTQWTVQLELTHSSTRFKSPSRQFSYIQRPQLNLSHPSTGLLMLLQKEVISFKKHQCCKKVQPL